MEKKLVIVGGGPAGSMAALAAARLGASVLLVEKHNCPGGNMTSGMLAFLGPFDNARRGQPDWTRFHLDRTGQPYPPELRTGAPVIGGLAEELAADLAAQGMIERPQFGYMPFNPEAVKLWLEDRMTEAGVELLYHTQVAAAGFRPGDGRPRLTLANSHGLTTVDAELAVDCSGNGDVAAWLGATVEFGRPGDGAAQGTTLVFWLGGVTADPLDLLPDTGTKFRESAAAAYRRGEFSLDPRGIGCPNYIPGMPGVVMVNLQHCFGIDGTDPAAVTAATVAGRRHIQEHLRFFRRYVPGFENAFLIATAPQLGIRETRRIVGDYMLSRRDVLDCAKFDDTVCRFNYDLDIHLPDQDGLEASAPPPGDWYDIPYRCLLPRGLDRVITAGRCISVDHYALSSMRLMSCCMALGQAAGTAAALALRNGMTPRQLPVETLQQTLRGQGALI